MTTSDFIMDDQKVWDVEMLKNFVIQEDIPLTRSLVIRQTTHRDTFCWSYTKSGQYTIKSGYWVARNILKVEDDNFYTEPSFIKLHAFACKIKAQQKSVISFGS